MKKSSIIWSILSWLFVLGCVAISVFVINGDLMAGLNEWKDVVLLEGTGIVPTFTDFANLATLWEEMPATICICGGVLVLTLLFFILEFIYLCAKKRPASIIRVLLFLVLGCAIAVEAYRYCSPRYGYEDGFGIIKQTIDGITNETNPTPIWPDAVKALAPIACTILGFISMIIADICKLAWLGRLGKTKAAKADDKALEEAAEVAANDETKEPIVYADRNVTVQYFNNFNGSQLSEGDIRRIIREELSKIKFPEPKIVERVVSKTEAKEEDVEEEVVASPKKKIIRIPFATRMKSAEKDMVTHYNDLKSYILAYGVNCRTSNSGDAFRLHTKTYVKITVAGKSLKLYMALDPKKYANSTIPVGDASSKAIYAEIPLIFKVKSELSVRRAKQLIDEAMAADGLKQGRVTAKNWAKEL